MRAPEMAGFDIIQQRKMRKITDAAKLNIYAERQAEQRDFFDASDGDNAPADGGDLSMEEFPHGPSYPPRRMIPAAGERKIRTTKLKPDAEDLGNYSARAQRVLQGGREETKIFTLTDNAWPTDEDQRTAAIKAHNYALAWYAEDAEACKCLPTIRLSVNLVL